MMVLRSNRMWFFGVSLIFVLMSVSGANGELSAENRDGGGAFLGKNGQIISGMDTIDSLPVDQHIIEDTSASLSSTNDDSDDYAEEQLLPKRRETQEQHVQSEVHNNDDDDSSLFKNNEQHSQSFEQINDNDDLAKAEELSDDVILSEPETAVSEVEIEDNDDDHEEFDHDEFDYDHDEYDNDDNDEYDEIEHDDDDFVGEQYMLNYQRLLSAYGRALAPMKGYGYGYSHYGLGHLYSGTNLFGGYINPQMYAGYPTPSPVYGGNVVANAGYASAAPVVYSMSSPYGGGGYGY